MSSSFVIISRGRPGICKEAIDSIINAMNDDNEIIVVVHNSECLYYRLAIKYSNVKFVFVNYECSLSYLWNKGIILAKHDHVFIANDKARPSKDDIIRSRYLNDIGYGLSGLFRFGFFSFYKDLIYRVGWFDQRFVKFGYEDTDFFCRLYDNDIAVYLSEEIHDYVMMPSTCGNTYVGRYYLMKKLSGDLNNIDYYPSERLSYCNSKVKYLSFNESEFVYPASMWTSYVKNEYVYKNMFDILIHDSMNTFIMIILSMCKLSIEKLLLNKYKI